MKRAFIGLSDAILEHLKKSAHYSVILLFLILSATNAPAESTNVLHCAGQGLLQGERRHCGFN